MANWEAAPLVEEKPAQPTWMSAPVLDAPMAPPQETPVQPAEATPERGGFLRSIRRGFNQAQRDVPIALGASGLLSPEAAAAGAQAQVPDLAESQASLDYERALQSFPKDGNISSFFSWIKQTPPGVFAELVGESFGRSAGGMVTSALGGAAGGTLGGPVAQATGFVAGTAAGSFATDYLAELSGQLEAHGIDINNEEQLRNALSNPELVAELKSSASKHGAGVAIVDTATSLLGLRGVGGALVRAGRAPTSKLQELATNVAGNTLVEAVGEGAGEALGQQLATGKIDLPDVLLESTVGLLGQVPQAGLEAAFGSSYQDAPVVEDTAESTTPAEPTKPPLVSAEEAETQGRTFFGVIDDTGVDSSGDQASKVPGQHTVTTSYNAADTRLAVNTTQGRVGRGFSLFAVKPEDVVATAFDLSQALKSADATARVLAESNIKQLPQETQSKVLTFLEDVKQKGASTALETTYQELLSAGLRIAPQGDNGIYLGNAALDAVVAPKTPNVSAGGITIDAAERLAPGVSGRYVDLDKFFAAAKKWLELAGPVNERFAALGENVVREYVDIPANETFDVFVNSDIKERVNSGELQLKRIDGRILSLFQVKEGETNNVKNAIRGTEFAKANVKGLTSHATQDAVTRHIAYHEALTFRTKLFPNQADDAERAHIFTLGDSSNFAQRLFPKAARAVDKVLRKLGLAENIIYVGIDSNLNPNFGDLLNTLPGIDGATVSRLRTIKLGWSGAAYHRPLTADTSLIVVFTDKAQSPFDVFHSLAHEAGHALSYFILSRASIATRARVHAAYRRYLTGVGSYNRTAALNARFGVGHKLSSDYISRNSNYILSYEEFIAEHTARWFTTNRRPQGLVASFFFDLSRKILKFFRQIYIEAKSSGVDLRPEVEIENWLSSMYDRTQPSLWASQERYVFEQQTRDINARYMGASAVSFQEETTNVRAVLDNFLDEAPNVPKQHQAKGIAAQVDRFNWFYKWFLHFRQVADMNPHIAGLQRYRELIELAQLEANKKMERAESFLKRWRQLRPTDGNLTQMFFDMTEMAYLTQAERRRGVRRHPTRQEFEFYARQHGLSDAAKQMYWDVQNEFRAVATELEVLSLRDAAKIADPAQQAAAVTAAQERTKRLLQAPYFPLNRFGKWGVTVYDANNKVEAFYTFETRRDQQSFARQLNGGLAVGQRIVLATLPDEVRPFIGMPPWLLDKIADMPGVTPDMKKWLQQLRYELAPTQSFGKRLIRRKNRKGYSLDAQRSYAHYFFHYSRNFARLKYGESIDAAVKELEDSRRTVGAVGSIADVNNVTRIASFLRDHYNEFLNPTQDWSLLRGITAVWHLGGVVSSATLNLSQSLIMTTPFLASKFGDVKAMAAMLRASKAVSTYYKRGSYENATELELRVLDGLIKENKITESMAAELAALSGDRKVNIGGLPIHESWVWISSKAMWLFQLMEQVNRRVTARAAFNLAYENPTAKWVQQLPNKHFLQYQRLLSEGWTAREATAYLAAKDAIDTTHFDYSKIARPRFMRGRKGILFAFQMFTQNTLFTLLNPENRGVFMRYALIMMVLAGPMGLIPDELKGILKYVAWKFFGKDFDLEREARKFVTSLMGEDSVIPPDLILHGIGRYGFGIPKLMDAIGATWYPYLDRSQSIALRQVLPVNVEGLLNPAADTQRAVSEGVQNVAGAGFGIGFNLYKTLTNTDLEWGDPKRWENALPRALKQGMRAVRLGREGGERDKNYNKLIDFDTQNPEHVAEIIATALGYNPTRVAQTWDRIAAEREVMAFYTIRKELLLREAYRQRFVYKDQDAYRKVLQDIQSYNKDAPDKKLRITRDTLKKSFKTRVDRKKKIEAGVVPTTSPGVRKQVNELYPEAVDRRVVK